MVKVMVEIMVGVIYMVKIMVMIEVIVMVTVKIMIQAVVIVMVIVRVFAKSHLHKIGSHVMLKHQIAFDFTESFLEIYCTHLTCSAAFYPNMTLLHFLQIFSADASMLCRYCYLKTSSLFMNYFEPFSSFLK